MLAEVDRVVVPALAGDEGEVGGVTRHDGDELGELAGSPVVNDDGGPRVVAGADDDVRVCGRAVASGAVEDEADRLRQLGVGRNVHEEGLGGTCGGHRGRAVLRGQDPELTCLGEGDRGRRDTLGQLGRPRRGGARPVREEGGELLHRGEAPLLLTTLGNREVGEVERCGALGPRLLGNERAHGVDVRLPATLRHPVCGLDKRVGNGHQPTAPSIWSSMRRLSSRAYSIGSSRAIGSMKPRTIIAMASSSAIPRDMR